MNGPVVAWVERETRAQLERFAEAQGIALERVAGDLLTGAVQRLGLPEPVLPDLNQPSSAEHRQALREAQAEAMTACGRPPHWRPVRPDGS
jgi:hypothetical protein